MIKKANEIKKKAPRQARSENTVGSILEATTRILKKVGPQGLTTNKIAEVAGISIGSLYQFYKNKDSIVEDLLFKVLNEVQEKTLAVLDEENLSPREMLRNLIELSMKSHVTKLGMASGWLLSEAPKWGGMKRFKKEEEKLIPAFIEKAKSKGIQFKSDHPEIALWVAIQTVRGVTYMSLFMDEQKYPRDKIIDVLTDMLEVALLNK